MNEKTGQYRISGQNFWYHQKTGQKTGRPFLGLGSPRFWHWGREPGFFSEGLWRSVLILVAWYAGSVYGWEWYYLLAYAVGFSIPYLITTIGLTILDNKEKHESV